MELRARCPMRPFIMNFLPPVLLVVFLLAMSTFGGARNASSHDCVSFADAQKHVGTSQCVIGMVLHIADGRGGTKLLNFCKEPEACPFTVVVFPADVKKMGDIRQLEGRQIEIRGAVQDYDGHAEIVLRRTQQLGDAAFLLVPPVPTDYDVERPGHYSPGKFRRGKNTKPKTEKQGQSVPLEDPEEPQSQLRPFPSATLPANTAFPATQCHHFRVHATWIATG